MICRVKLHHFLIAAALGMLTACASPPTSSNAVVPMAVAAQQAAPEETLNSDVRQDTIQQTICIAGYTASIRPSTTYTNAVKLDMLREQGLPASVASDFELDHRVPLALGGHPRNRQNLQLQPWEGKDGAKVKDRLERRLQRLVCAGKLLLDDARRAIYVDWQEAYRSYVVTTP